MQKIKNIVVAPLNWGLGHATRCIPIIIALQRNGFTPILASDGVALRLLQKEFPELEHIKLPTYGIKYPKNGKFFIVKLLLRLPKIMRAIAAEKKQINSLIKNRNIAGIISDNRFGVRDAGVPSVYVTHQLEVLSGVFTFFSSKVHQSIIKKFDECWVPDVANKINFSGKLGHLKITNFNVKYIGVLSRFLKQETVIKYDYLVLLSGPEPQRTFLEEKLLKEYENTTKKVVFVLGRVEGEQTCIQKGNSTIYNFMLSSELSKTIQESEVIIARSGYTTIMDLAKLHKKAFFIPTPGQFEQLYLAKRLDALNWVPFATQKSFNLNNLEKIADYKGMSCDTEVEFHHFFKIFNRGAIAK